jgi:hypothetical protein
MAFVEDPTAFLQDFGVPVTWGAVSGEGFLDRNAQLVNDGNVINVDYLLHGILRSLFQGIKYNDPVTVDGEAFLVREPLSVDDGTFMMVSLSKVDEAQLPDYVLDGELGFDDSSTVVVYEGDF